MQPIIKTDRYKHTRGGGSRVLNIFCQKCGVQICTYQKDGPGSLLRMYLDRISNPTVSIAGEALICPNGHLLGVKMVYTKEKRLAFRLPTGAVTKKIVKG